MAFQTDRCEKRPGEIHLRYDQTVWFRRISKGEYDPETGNYSEPVVTETPRSADVMDTTKAMLKLVYGRIRQGSLTVQLQNHYDEPFDNIRIGDTVYIVDHRRKLRVKETFVVSEVQ